MSTLCECFDCIKEVVFCLLIPIDNGLSGVLRELHIFDDELVQIVSQKVSACVAPVAVEDAEEAALGPVLDILLGGWLHDVKNNADAVLVVVPDDSLICVRGVPHDEAILTNAALGRLPAWQVEGSRVWRWTVAEEQLFDVKWLVILGLTWRSVLPVSMALDHG